MSVAQERRTGGVVQKSAHRWYSMPWKHEKWT